MNGEKGNCHAANILAEPMVLFYLRIILPRVKTRGYNIGRGNAPLPQVNKSIIAAQGPQDRCILQQRVLTPLNG
jgi:hypothetical protein